MFLFLTLTQVIEDGLREKIKLIGADGIFKSHAVKIEQEGREENPDFMIIFFHQSTMISFDGDYWITNPDSEIDRPSIRSTLQMSTSVPTSQLFSHPIHIWAKWD